MAYFEDTVRREWYETDSYVYMSILMEKMRKEVIRVDLTEEMVVFAANLPHDQCFIQLKLPHKICPDQSSWEVLPSKIEIKLKKLVPIKWKTLHGEHPTSLDEPKEKIYWDKLAECVAEEEEVRQMTKEEEEQPGDALYRAMMKLYSKSSDDVKKSMAKSYTESGGTVLSMDWNKVKSRRVDPKEWLE